MSTKKKPNRVMIAVSIRTHERLVRLQQEMLASYEKGNGFSNMPLTEQGERGVWIAFGAVIDRALDEFESHRKRSNQPKRRHSTKTTNAADMPEGCIHPMADPQSDHGVGAQQEHIQGTTR